MKVFKSVKLEKKLINSFVTQFGDSVLLRVNA